MGIFDIFKKKPTIEQKKKEAREELSRLSKVGKFPDRTESIIRARKSARQYLANGNFDMARQCYFNLVESIRQQNINEDGAREEELREAEKEYAEFSKKDPMYIDVMEKTKPILENRPGIKQTDIYNEIPEFTKQDLRYVFYYAEKNGEIKRVKKGRTYVISEPEK